MHQRDVGALLCPIGTEDPKELERLWSMLKRAPRVPNSFFVTMARSVQDGRIAAEARKRAEAEIEGMRRRFPDFDSFRPEITGIVAKDPAIELEAAYWQAKKLREERERPPVVIPTRKLYSRVAISREEIERSARRGVRGIDWLEAADDRIERGTELLKRQQQAAAAEEARKPSPEPSTIGTSKRRYNLDE